jgi:hypothetical protein
MHRADCGHGGSVVLASALLFIVAACSDGDGREGFASQVGAAEVGVEAGPHVADAGPHLRDDALLAFGAQLAIACPVVAADDASERERCADALTEVPLLREAVADPLLWGAQPAGLPLALVPEQAALTNFSSLVWRRIYLSTLMFEGPAVVERAGLYRALRVPSRFRNGLDAGDYPYPFWHAEKKWASYEQSTHIIFLFDETRLVASVRSEQLDPSRPHIPRSWTGVWTWDDGQQPEATLFRALFSEANPFVAPLVESYRALSQGFRAHTCTSCHSPNNPAAIKRLDILNYPNQSLSGRHRIVRMIELNQMPPPTGIADEVERLALLAAARKFAQLGDRALAFDGERTPASEPTEK